METIATHPREAIPFPGSEISTVELWTEERRTMKRLGRVLLLVLMSRQQFMDRARPG
jgi:hypothetical protein